MKLEISPQEVQHYISSLRGKENESEIDLDFQHSAAVLIKFDPMEIYPFSLDQGAILHPEKKEWFNFFRYCDPVPNKAGDNWWQLRPNIRRNALQRLQENAKITQALAASPDRIQDDAQQLFETVLEQMPIDIDNLSRVMLVTLSEILDWVKGVFPTVSELSHRISRAIPMADLLAPMHRLSVDFVGRKKELKQLGEYVGIIPTQTSNLKAATRFFTRLFKDFDTNPPFLLHGPGGVGKSTLLAKFILENTHSNNKEPLPFAYLDIDKACIDLEWPESFLIETARQLSTQIPEGLNQFISLKEEMERMHSRYDALEISKSNFSTGMAVENLGMIISSIKTPVLIVVDTFEEAQYLGAEVVRVVWHLLASLQKVAHNLRIIVAGRIMVKEYLVKDLELKELSKEEAHELLSNGLRQSMSDQKLLDSFIADIIDTVGLNPMSLRLALVIVKEQGIDKLKKVETKSFYFIRLKEEVIQARLYGRILAHVHDDDVRKLAFPGLIVRRINPEIILKVLAGPCKLTINTIDEASKLFEKLAKEGALMTVDPDSDALNHRADVRKLMLQDLKTNVPADTIQAIHDTAVKFYEEKEDRISRAEEIYHRLSRGDVPEKVASRWMEGVEPRLRNALQELPVDARIWLSGKLGVTPDESLLKNANLDSWEEITARTAQRFLTNGEASKALALMRERTKWSAESQLYRLELETMRMMRLYDEAYFTVNETIASLPNTTSPEFKIMLFKQAALVNEALNQLDEAIAHCKEAEKLITDPPKDRMEAIRILITHIRLLRKKGASEDLERGVLIKRIMQLLMKQGSKLDENDITKLKKRKSRLQFNQEVLTSLHSSPALLQELVAELGKVVSQFIPFALDQVGLEIRTDSQKTMLAQALKDWNDELLTISPTGPGELVERSGISNNSVESWLQYINKNTGRTIGADIYNWKYEILTNKAKSQSTTNFDKVLVELSRKNVDMAINKDLEMT